MGSLSGDKDFVVRPCGCGSMACPHCRNARAMELKDKFLDSLSRGCFSAPGSHNYMVTLTVPREKLAVEYYKIVSKRRGIGEFARHIGAIDWVMCHECHKDGYLHYHMIVNVPNRLDYTELHSSGKLSAAWPYGRVNFVHIVGRDIVRALSYIVSYITFTYDDIETGHKHQFADWILDLSHFRFYSTSRGLFGLSHRVKNYDNDDVKEVCKEYSKPRSLRDRMKKCCRSISVFNQLGEFVRSVCIPFDDFLRLNPLYVTRYVMRDGWRSARKMVFASLDGLNWLADALVRLSGSGYVSDDGSVTCFPLKIPLSDDSDWLRRQEDRYSSDLSYHRDYWGRYCLNF